MKIKIITFSFSKMTNFFTNILIQIKNLLKLEESLYLTFNKRSHDFTCMDTCFLTIYLNRCIKIQTNPSYRYDVKKKNSKILKLV